MRVLEILLLCSRAAVLLWGGWTRGGHFNASIDSLAYMSQAQVSFGSLSFLCSWSFDIICTYHPAPLVEDSG